MANPKNNITLQLKGLSLSLEAKPDKTANIFDALQLVVKALHGIGYSVESINEGVRQLALVNSGILGDLTKNGTKIKEIKNKEKSSWKSF